jgi:hypothetical protein
VLEWCQGGSLFDIVHRRQSDLPKEQRLHLAIGAMAGVYVRGCGCGFVTLFFCLKREKGVAHWVGWCVCSVCMYMCV